MGRVMGETQVQRKSLLEKILAIVIPLVISSILLWGSWMTVKVFHQDECTASEAKQAEGVKQSIDELKAETKEIKKELKEQSKQAEENYQDMMRVLLDIKREKKGK